MDEFENDDAVLQYLLEMGALNPEQAKLERQRARAAALMSTPMPQGQMVGGHYIAPGLGASLAAGLGQVAGAYGDYKARQKEEELEGRRRSALEALAARKARRPVNAGQGMSLPSTFTTEDLNAY